MTALYSVNLRIAGMKANLPFLSQDTILDNEWTRNSLPASVRPYIVVIILAVIALICKVRSRLVLKYEIRLSLRSRYNAMLVTSLAEDKGRVKIIGLAIANGFAALAGGVPAQKQAFFDISIGTGTMVFGLASAGFL